MKYKLNTIFAVFLTISCLAISTTGYTYEFPHNEITVDDYTTIDNMLKSGLSANAKNDYGVSLLMWAAKCNSFNTTAILIENGADTNLPELLNKTSPLMLAARYNSSKVAKLLIDKKTDINDSDALGNTALIYAVQYNSKETIRILIENGADISTKNFYNKTALDIAKENNNIDMVTLLENAIRKNTAHIKTNSENINLKDIEINLP